MPWYVWVENLYQIRSFVRIWLLFSSTVIKCSWSKWKILDSVFRCKINAFFFVFLMSYVFMCRTIICRYEECKGAKQRAWLKFLLCIALRVRTSNGDELCRVSGELDSLHCNRNRNYAVQEKCSLKFWVQEGIKEVACRCYQLTCSWRTNWTDWDPC